MEFRKIFKIIDKLDKDGYLGGTQPAAPTNPQIASAGVATSIPYDTVQVYSHSNVSPARRCEVLGPYFKCLCHYNNSSFYTDKSNSDKSVNINSLPNFEWVVHNFILIYSSWITVILGSVFPL